MNKSQELEAELADQVFETERSKESSYPVIERTETAQIGFVALMEDLPKE